MKLSALLLSAALAAALLAGCAPAESAPAEPTAAPTASPLPEDSLDEPATPPEGVDPDATAAPGLGDVAPVEQPEPDADLAEMVTSLYEAYPVEIMMPQTSAIDLSDESWLSYNTGLTLEQGELVDAGVLSESMTGSQAYSLVLLRLKDEANAQTIADAMLANLNPAKWICTMANVQRVVAFDDKILYVMANTELADVDALVEAAADAWGVTFSYDQRAEGEV